MRANLLVFLLVLACGATAVAKPSTRGSGEPSEAAATESGPELTSGATAARLGSGIGDSRPFGLGVVIGQPLGATLKYFLAPELAVQGVAAWWFFGHSGMVVGADLAYHLRDLAPKLRPVEIGAYFGAGAGLGVWEARVYHEHTDPWPHWHSHPVTELIAYLRPVAGASLLIRETPVEAFIELAPTYLLSPDRDFGFGGALGARYYF